VFCRKSLLLFTVEILFALASWSCTRGQKAARERLAVARFENLSSDSRLDWAGHALAAGMVYDLAPSGELHAQMVDSISGAYAARASRVMEGYFYERNGRLEVVATLEDLRRTKAVASFELSGPASEGMLPLLNQLAKRLSRAARPFGTDKPEAFRAYGEALEASDRQTMLRDMDSATAADAHFVAAYLARARFVLAAGDREQGLRILAAARGTHPDAIDAGEIEYLSATVSGDGEARGRALATLTRLCPADAGRFKELAQLRFSQRKFQDAVRSYESAAGLDAEEPETWNELGYAYALNQDLAGARRALERYQSLLAPPATNALDSLGEVSFFLGDFGAATKYFVEAHDRNPAQGGAELVKAAEARLMAGDLRDGDALFQRYAGEPGQSLRGRGARYEGAQWEFLTGRRKAGMARLEKLIPMREGDELSFLLCQLAIWKLETGSEKEAAELIGKAEGAARSPRTRSLIAMCRVIMTKPSNGSGSRVADAYALLFARKYAEAVPLLEAIYRETNPAADGQVRTLLAWAYVETGRFAEARKLVQIYPLPLSSGDPVFASLVFPRILYLRGAVLQNEGRGAEAKRSMELFLKYAGDVPDVFGSKGELRLR
jgi:Flp pilus assembly protein TadD